MAPLDRANGGHRAWIVYDLIRDCATEWERRVRETTSVRCQTPYIEGPLSLVRGAARRGYLPSFRAGVTH
jgi:hypothetical protein